MFNYRNESTRYHGTRTVPGVSLHVLVFSLTIRTMPYSLPWYSLPVHAALLITGTCEITKRKQKEKYGILKLGVPASVCKQYTHQKVLLEGRVLVQGEKSFAASGTANINTK